MKCPLVKSLTPMGCLLNRVKYESCDACPGIEGYADHIGEVMTKLTAMATSSILPMPKAVLGLPGIFVAMEQEKIKVLEQRGVFADQVDGMLDLFLSGDLCQRKPVMDPITKSRLRPEGP